MEISNSSRLGIHGPHLVLSEKELKTFTDHYLSGDPDAYEQLPLLIAEVEFLRSALIQIGAEFKMHLAGDFIFAERSFVRVGHKIDDYKVFLKAYYKNGNGRKNGS